MKNISAFLISCLLLLAVLGCGVADRVQEAINGKTPDSNASPTGAGNKSITDQATESLLRDKIGVPECDEVFDLLADQSRNQDDGIAAKAMKELVFNRIRQSLKENIEKNQNDKAKLAQNCKEYKAQLDKFQAERNSGEK